MFWYIIGTIIFFVLFATYCEKIMKRIQGESKRYAYLYGTAYNWLRNSSSREKIENWCKEKGISSVAIYGVDGFGRHLLEEFEGTDIQVKFLVDRNIRREVGEYAIYSTSDELPEIEVIIITSVYEFDTIAPKLKVKDTTRIVSLEEVISGLNDVKKPSA